MMFIIDYLQHVPIAFYIFVVIFGLMIGSFINVVAYRLPKMLESSWLTQCLQFLQEQSATTATPLHCPTCGQALPKALNENKSNEEKVVKKQFNLCWPSSHCPHCSHTISVLENIPIISYLVLRGRCKHCQHPIGIRYPIIEGFTALLTFVVAWHFGLQWTLLAALLLSFILMTLSVIDIDHQLLPDNITLPGLWLGLIVNYYGLFVSLSDAVIGALVGYLFLWSVYWLFKIITKKEGMGYGDFKLLGLLGAWLGWQVLPLIILLSSLLGSIVGISAIIFRGCDKNLPIPFGPFIACAGWIAMIWGEQLTTLYLR